MGWPSVSIGAPGVSKLIILDQSVLLCTSNGSLDRLRFTPRLVHAHLYSLKFRFLIRCNAKQCIFFAAITVYTTKPCTTHHTLSNSNSIVQKPNDPYFNQMLEKHKKDLALMFKETFDVEHKDKTLVCVINHILRVVMLYLILTISRCQNLWNSLGG